MTARDFVAARPNALKDALEVAVRLHEQNPGAHNEIRRQLGIPERCVDCLRNDRPLDRDGVCPACLEERRKDLDEHYREMEGKANQ